MKPNQTLYMAFGGFVGDSYIHIPASEKEWDKFLVNEKNKMQEAEGYNNTAVNIFIVVDWSFSYAKLAKFADALRNTVAGEIAIHATLVVFFCESNAGERKAVKEFMLSLAENPPFANIFLVSDRDENGRVSADNHKKAHRALQFLPQLVNSSFRHSVESLAAASGKVLFSAIGFGEGVSSDHNLYWHRFADFLEKEMTMRNPIPTFTETHFINASDDFATCITENIAAVAAKPLSFFSLIGSNLQEAEDKLYGNNASMFFDDNYSVVPKEPPRQLKLRDIATREHGLCLFTSNIPAEDAPPRQLHFTINRTKTAIGHSYAVKFRQKKARAAHSAATAEQEQLASFIAYMTEVIAGLRALPITQNNNPLSIATDQATLNIALLRNDGLIYEAAQLGTEENPCILRLAGGFRLEDMLLFNMETP